MLNATKQKIREALKGRKMPESTKVKLSMIMKGRVFTDEARQKMRDSAVKKWKNFEPALLAEMKKKMSASAIERHKREKLQEE